RRRARRARGRARARRFRGAWRARCGRRMTGASPLERTREAMRAAGVDAVLAASPGLVAFLTGHVVPAHLAYPSRDGRLEKPTLALVTQDGAATADSGFDAVRELDLGRPLAVGLARAPAGP